MARFANVEWELSQGTNGGPKTLEQVNIAMLMDIRDQLQQLNRTLGCPNVAKGFRALQRIARLDEQAFKRRVARAVQKRKARAK